MNDFHRDDTWQKQMRDELLVPFYRKNFLGFLFFDRGRFAESQQERDVDTITWKADLQPVAIEEKIVRYPGYAYTAICLETESCTTPGRMARGWMWYSAADILLYCMQTEGGDLDCRSIDFPKLHDWFWPIEKEFPLHVMANTINKTASRIVPLDRIQPFVRSRFLLTRLAQEAA